MSSLTRVMILRPDNLGDVILFSGGLGHIRLLYPDAEITLYVKSSVYDLVALCPFVDQVLEYEKISSLPLYWLPNGPGKYRLNWLMRKLLNKRYKTDILLLPVRSPTAGLFGIHSIVSTIFASEKIGISGDFANQTHDEDKASDTFYFKTLKLEIGDERIHELEINKRFLEFLGLNLSEKIIWPEFWTDKKDRLWASNLIPREDKVVTLAISPGVTSLPGKFYPAGNYTRAISGLRDIQFSVQIFGSTADENQCREVAQALTKCENIKSINNFAGVTTLRQMVEGIRQCDLLISPDTGALHIGVALRKPTVGILGGGHYGRFYPWGDQKINRVANKRMDCYWCNWHCIYPTIRCIQEIHPEVIAEQLKFALLESRLI